jgi:hypothetical protein
MTIPVRGKDKKPRKKDGYMKLPNVIVVDNVQEWRRSDFQVKNGSYLYESTCIDCENIVLTRSHLVHTHQGRCISCKQRWVRSFRK